MKTVQCPVTIPCGTSFSLIEAIHLIASFGFKLSHWEPVDSNVSNKDYVYLLISLNNYLTGFQSLMRLYFLCLIRQLNNKPFMALLKTGF